MSGLFCLGLLIQLALFVVIIAVLIAHDGLKRRVAELEKDWVDLDGKLERVRKRMLDAETELGRLRKAPPAAVAPPLAEAPPTPAPPAPAEPVMRIPAWQVRVKEIAKDKAAGAPPAGPLAEEIAAVASETAPPTAPPPVEPPAAAPPRPTVGPPPVAPPPRRPVAAPPPRPPAPPRKPIDLEALGYRAVVVVAALALLIGTILFLKVAIDQGWLGPTMRMAMGIAVGTGLLVVCETKRARRHEHLANALDAAAIGILFATFFAAHARWHLLSQPTVFALMTLVTAAAVLLSIRHDALFIALLGLLGGFSTPALLSTGEDRPIGLFGYLLLLNAGLAWVAYTKRWPALTTASIVLTFLYQWGWVAQFLRRAEQVPIALGIFLVFPVLHVFALVLSERGEEKDRHWLFAPSALGAALLPLLFFLYLAAVPAYGTRYTLLFGFLLLLDAAMAVLAVARGPGMLHAVAGAGTVAALAIWLAVSYTEAAWPSVLGFVAAFVLLYLLVEPLAEKAGKPLLGLARVGTVTASLSLVAFPALCLLEERTKEPGVLFTALFALLAIVAVAAVKLERGGLHFTAAFFALAAEAIWSAKNLTPARLIPALTIYGGFALFYLAVPLVAQGLGKSLRPEGSGAILLLVSIALVLFLAGTPVAATALWGIAILLGVLNAGLFIEGSFGRMPVLSLAGILLSWIVIAVWWITAAVTSFILVPALLVVAGFAVLTVSGTLVASGTAEKRGAKGAPVMARGPGMALVGHLFLLFVATQKELANPPWPWLGVLLVLDLAVAAASLYLRSGVLLVASMAATQIILICWRTDSVFSQDVALLAGAGAVALALGMLPLARRRGAGGIAFPVAAVVAILLGQLLAFTVGIADEPPPLPHMALDQVALLGAILGLAAAIGWRWLAVPALVWPTISCAAWHGQHLTKETWLAALGYDAAIYLPFLLFPALLGARAGADIAPALSAVLGSASFFFLARHDIETGGHADVIGILPVAQAALMMLLFVRHLQMEPKGKRAMGRLALVTGTALAFVTVAIPLQLDHEWITIGWALEAAALAWLYGRIPHEGLLAASLGLAATVFVRLSVNPAVLTYHPRSSVPIVNWYLYTYLVAAAALYATGALVRKLGTTWPTYTPRPAACLYALATVLLFLLLNIEIADFYSPPSGAITFNFTASLTQDLTYTLGWAVFAIGMLVAGIASRSLATRLFSLLLLTATIVKCFLHDLVRLKGLQQAGSLLGLAVCLILVAILMQVFVLSGRKKQDEPDEA